ncbi:hypothetical protein J2S13_000604 [Oikeobacillus pervagus]|uniref:Spore germination protein n=1 Tax=Oikeobacillus pervagus TaxID=1325931 RepID=A0AAJ1SWM0_9BACI|nr:hypothetical protein [Oikeobacillus pervagus]
MVVAYIEKITNLEIVSEVENHLSKIKIDTPLESGIIEQWIEDNALSPFPQFVNTERPDRVISGLLKGKLSIMTEGTPFVLIAPITIADTIDTPDDYYERWFIGALVRILRFLAMIISIFLPAFYVALVSFHQGLIPSKLAFSIAASREGVPFPAFVEASMMAITMEMLREAGLRLPSQLVKQSESLGVSHRRVSCTGWVC